MKSEIAIYENFRFSPVFPVSPILIHSSFDSKSFTLSSGKISSQNNTDIVWGRPTSGLDFRPEVENMTMHNLKVNSIHPQSFIPIGPRVSEIMGNTPKMNAILELKMKNMILSKMVTEILQSDERPVKDLIHGQINRLKGMLGLDRILRFHYMELLSLPGDQMGTVYQIITVHTR